MTADDYLAMADDGRRYQLFDGELVEMTPGPSVRHQLILRQMIVQLHGHAEARGLGTIIPSPVDVILGPRTVIQPDLLFIAAAHLAALDMDRVRIAPDLAVEILSLWTRSEDLGRKADVYAAAGVAHYWIVDPEARSIAEWILEGGRFVERSRASSGERFHPALFPGLELDLDTLFRA
jgi:Uma2 family endonuclease